MNEQNNVNPTSTPEVPVQPVTPIEPIQPVAPIVPETPVQPEAVVQPVTPVTPVQPEAVVQPVTPVAPVQPEVPVQPVTPVAPVQPEVAAQPVAPVAPVQSEVSGQPVAPVVPQQPVVNGMDNQAVATVANGGIQPQGVIAPSVPVNGPIDSTNVGFVQTGTDLKKKTNPAIIVGIVAVIIIILGAVGYFVVYPKIMDKLSDPKTVFKNTIETMNKEVSTKVSSIVHNKGLFEIKVAIDSDIEQLENYSGYTYSGRFGVDPENRLLEAGFGVLDNSTKKDINNYYYLKNNSVYTKFSTNRDLLYLGSVDNSEMEELDKLFDTFNSILTNMDESMSQNADIMINSLFTAFSNSLNDNNFSKADASISVAGNNLKVKKNIYHMDKATVNDMFKKMVEELSNNDDFVDCVYKNLNTYAAIENQEISKQDVKEMISSLKDSEIEVDDDLSLDLVIYTYGTKSEFVGMQITDGKDDIHYYTYNGSYEIIVSGEENDALSIIGVANGSVTNTSIKIDGTEYATLKISKWTDTEVEFDYVLNIPADLMESSSSVNTSKDEKYVFTGSFSYKETTTNENTQNDIEFKLVLPDKTHFNVKVSVLNDWTTDIASINTSTATTPTDSDLETITSQFLTYLMETPVKALIGTLSGYNDNNSYNSYDNYDYDSDSYYGYEDDEDDDSYSSSYSDDTDDQIAYDG